MRRQTWERCGSAWWDGEHAVRTIQGIGRLLRFRWTPGGVVALVVGLGCGAIVVLAVVTVLTRDPNASVARPRAPISSVCKQVTPAAPDFDAPPFDFDPAVQARTFVQSIVRGDLRLVYGMLSDEHMSYIRVCSSRQLEAFRSTLTSHGPASVEVDPDRRVSFLPLQDVIRVPLRVAGQASGNDPTQSQLQYLTVSLLRDGRVAAYQLDEARTTQGPVRAFAVPPYVDLTRFEESSVALGDAPWAVGGTLTIPRGAGPFPAIVLVQGLDAADRDATVGANKWLRDVAWGLASRGVATLRYDQRTWTHALAFARQTDFTLAEVSVDDAAAAVRVLRQTPQIDPARVYALGHLSGAFAAARVSAQDPGMAGLILIWPLPGTPLQYAERLAQWLDTGGDDLREHERATINDVRAQAGVVAALMAGEPQARRMGVRPGFQTDLARYSLEDLVRNLKHRVLLLHGARNVLLEAEDVLTWFSLTEVRTDISIRGYEDYSLGVIDWRRLSDDDTYALGHVAPEAITDLEKWLTGRWPARLCNGDTWLEGCQ